MAFSPHYASNHLFYVSYTDRNGNSRVARYQRRERPRRALERPHPARRPPAVRQPQRRPAPVRQARLPLLRARRRRLRRRPEPDLPEHAHAARQAAACEARRLRATPGRSSGSASATRGASRSTRRTSNLWIGDVGQDTWEEVDFRAAAKLDKLANYGWSRYEGYSVYSLEPSLRRASAQKVKPVHRLLARARLLDHRRLRLPRRGGARPRAGGTSTATTAPGRSGASGSASTAVPRPRPSRARCRRSPRSASTGTASCTPSPSAGRSTSSVEWVTGRMPSRSASSVALLLVARPCSPPAGAAARLAASRARARPSRPRATTGRASAGTRAARATTRTRPGSPRRTSGRSTRQQVHLPGTVDSSADLPPRRDGQRREPRRVLRHDDVRDHARDRRHERRDPLALDAARLLPVGRLRPDHDGDSGRRSQSQVDLRGFAGRADPEAHRRERPCRLAAHDHGAAVAREDRGLAQLRRAATSSRRPAATSATSRRTRGMSSIIAAGTAGCSTSGTRSARTGT